jgi:hypothetical protein
MKKENNDEMFCVGCYSEEKCVPNTREYIPFAELVVTEEDMVKALHSLGMQARGTDDMMEVSNIYDALISNKLAIYYGPHLLSRLIFPTHDSTYLKTIVRVSLLDFKKGGRYFASNEFTTQQKIEITQILTQLANTPESLNSNEDRTYQVIPIIIREFANGARIFTGFRLLKRAIRHAMDPKAIDIRGCICNVFQEDGKIGLVIEHEVKASMKKIYTKQELHLPVPSLCLVPVTVRQDRLEEREWYVFIFFPSCFKSVNSCILH